MSRRITSDHVWFILIVGAIMLALSAIIVPIMITQGDSETRVEQITHVAKSCPEGTVPKVNFEGDNESENGHMTGFTCVVRK